MSSMIVRPSMRDIRVYTVGAHRRALLQEVERYEEQRRAQRKRIDKHARFMSPMLVNPFIYGGGAAAPDTPDVILGADLLAWYQRGTGIYDAVSGGSLVSSDATEIGRWEDQSGNGHHMTRVGLISVGHTQWSSSVTHLGVGTVHFMGSADAYFVIPDAVGSALSTAGEGEIAVCLKMNSAVGGTGLWSFGTAGGELYAWSDGHVYEDFGRGSRPDIGTPAVDISTAFRVYDCWSASADWGAEIDGNAMGATGTNTPAFLTTGLRFGCNNGSNTIVGWVSDMVICKRKFTSGERSDIRTYFTT